ncbi:MAG: pteridine-dependent deoxygenase [Gammaproteobacteria bacterium]|nr:pteridine-dependent deoxygenase [Gammaproteobacteria bacterium]
MASDFLPACTLFDPAAAREFENDPNTLALIRFGSPPKAADEAAPWIDSGLELLGGRAIQAWRVATPVEHGRMGPFAVHLAQRLGMLATPFPDSEDPETAAFELYSGLLSTARQLDLPHILRIWQYLPRINASLGDEDRYRAFCAGRGRALEAEHRGHDALPAACLLGNDSDRILLYALIASRPGRQIENPRQQSAFRYPPRYGRKSPSFSRATAAGNGKGERLFISGTSSITGHASRHGKTLEQLAETIKNLEALLERWQGSPASLAAIAPMKVYLRRAADLDDVRGALDSRLPAGHPVTYLRADVCRPELNIEIEGIVQP